MEEREWEGMRGNKSIDWKGGQPPTQARSRGGVEPGFRCMCMCVIIFESITYVCYIYNISKEHVLADDVFSMPAGYSTVVTSRTCNTDRLQEYTFSRNVRKLRACARSGNQGLFFSPQVCLDTRLGVEVRGGEGILCSCMVREFKGQQPCTNVSGHVQPIAKHRS